MKNYCSRPIICNFYFRLVGKERAAANLINEALLGEEFDDDRMTQESLDLDSEVEAEGMLTQRNKNKKAFKHGNEHSGQSRMKSQSLSKDQMKAQMPILATAPKDKASQEQQPPAAMRSSLRCADPESEVNAGQKESNSNEVDNRRTYTEKKLSPKVGLGVKYTHRKIISSTNNSSKSDSMIIRAKQSELKILNSQSERGIVRDSDNRSQSTSQNQHLADDIASPFSQLYAERTSSSSMDPEHASTMDGLDCDNLLDSKRLKARNLNIHDKRTNASNADVVVDADESNTSIKGELVSIKTV